MILDSEPYVAPRPVTLGRVGVFAGSSPFSEERYAAGRDALIELGFSVVEHPSIRERNGYLAGTDEARVSAIHDLARDPGVDALWAVRGGYGLHRIVDRLDAELLRKAQKPILGFSDVCVLHALLQSKARMISIHAPVLTQLGELDAKNREIAKTILAGAWSRVVYRSNEPPIRTGIAEGRVVGGCLSVLCALVGTRFLPTFEGAILLLEDVQEATYRIDRMLTHLLQSGNLARVAGIVLGEFRGCTERQSGEQTLDQVLRERLDGLGVPVARGFPFGHGSQNWAIPLGARVRLDAEEGLLEILGT